MDANMELVAEKFHLLLKDNLEDAVKYVTRDGVITTSVSQALMEQKSPDKFSAVLFEWLYTCAQLKPKSKDMYMFCLQFAPDLILLYLTAIYEDLDKLKANAEALLSTLMMEVFEEIKGHHVQQVPALSKSSIYHQTPSLVSQPFLTEAVLQLHNELDIVPKRPTYSNTAISLNNRPQFLASVIHTFADHLMLFGDGVKENYCQFCIRLALQGMANLESNCVAMLEELPPEHGNILTMKRFTLSDGLVTSMLRGVRICLFQSCHEVARQALQALTLRSEYELLINSIQVSHTILRLSKDVEPQELQLDTEKHSKYYGPGSPDFTGSPGEIHTSLNSYLLHHNLAKHGGSPPDTPTPSSSTSYMSGFSKSTVV